MENITNQLSLHLHLLHQMWSCRVDLWMLWVVSVGAGGQASPHWPDSHWLMGHHQISVRAESPSVDWRHAGSVKTDNK